IKIAFGCAQITAQIAKALIVQIAGTAIGYQALKAKYLRLKRMDVLLKRIALDCFADTVHADFHRIHPNHHSSQVLHLGKRFQRVPRKAAEASGQQHAERRMPAKLLYQRKNPVVHTRYISALRKYSSTLPEPAAVL